MAGGKIFQGGTIAGIKSKLDYLQNLGVKLNGFYFGSPI
jgi:glycosidase